jgi:hypothetical protein
MTLFPSFSPVVLDLLFPFNHALNDFTFFHLKALNSMAATSMSCQVETIIIASGELMIVFSNH